MKAVKFVCIILSSMLIFCMSINVYADEEDYEDTDNNEEYYYEEYEDDYDDEYEEEYSYEESEEYIEESYEEYYYEEETVSEISQEIVAEVSEEISQEAVEEVIEEISETVTEEVSPVAEVSTEQSEVSEKKTEEKSLVSEISAIKEEVSEVSKPAVQRVVNIADDVKEEDSTANEISGNVMWGIIFILLIFCIIFLPRTRGMEFVKDRYRYRKAKNITRRHIR